MSLPVLKNDDHDVSYEIPDLVRLVSSPKSTTSSGSLSSSTSSSRLEETVVAQALVLMKGVGVGGTKLRKVQPVVRIVSSSSNEGGNPTKKYKASSATATSTEPIMGGPLPTDIIFGRGSSCNRHPGNMKYRDMVGDCKAQYAVESRSGKRHITLSLVGQWKAQGGRFLKRSEGTGDSSISNNAGGDYWYEVDDKDALAKTSQLLREKRTDGSCNSGGSGGGCVVGASAH